MEIYTLHKFMILTNLKLISINETNALFWLRNYLCVFATHNIDRSRSRSAAAPTVHTEGVRELLIKKNAA